MSNVSAIALLISASTGSKSLLDCSGLFSSAILDPVGMATGACDSSALRTGILSV